MTDEPQKTRRALWPIVCALIALPLLYVFSVGPVSYFAARSGGTASWLDAAKTVYAPLIWLHDNTPLKKPLEWYTQKWEKLAD
jgi:hypothetical protein